jgi:hypothetical protein
MSRRWWRSGHLKPGEEVVEHGSTLRYEPGWRLKMAMNAFGGLCTAVVMLVFSLTKFHDGAYIVLIIMPVLMGLFKLINRHYRGVAKSLSLDHYLAPASRATRHRVLMPVSGVHQGTLEALRYAHMLSHDVTAVHVSIDPEETEKVKRKWHTWGDGTRLYILDSPYRLFIEPLLQYIDEILAQRQPNEVITIVVPSLANSPQSLHEHGRPARRSCLPRRDCHHRRALPGIGSKEKRLHGRQLRTWSELALRAKRPPGGGRGSGRAGLRTHRSEFRTDCPWEACMRCGACPACDGLAAVTPTSSAVVAHVARTLYNLPVVVCRIMTPPAHHVETFGMQIGSTSRGPAPEGC